MSRNRPLKSITLILFSGLVCFYYIIPQVFAYIFEAVILLLAIKEKSKRLNPVPLIWYGAFFMYIFVDAVFRDTQMIYVSSCLNVAIFILILCLLIDSEEWSILFIKASAFFGSLFSLFILLRYGSFIGVGRLGMELPGTRIESAITLGYIFLYIMCLQIYTIININSKSFEKIIIIAGLLLSLYLTVLTGTRKALYIPVLYLLVSVFIKNRKYYGKLLLYLAALSILGVFSFRYMLNNEIISSDNFARMQGSLALFSDKYDMDESTMERKMLAEKATELFYQRPLLGNGTDYTISILTKHPHNNYLSTLSMGGIIMFLLYYWIYLFCCLSSRMNRKKYLPLFLIIAFVLPLSDLGTTSFNIIYFNLLICLFVLTAENK